MGKIFKALIIIGIVIIVLGFCGMKNEIFNSKEEAITTINENAERGMKVTLLGGSNMENKGNVNSMGYCIVTANDELIFIDGGRDIDSELVKFFADKYGNGKVDHWFITHPHSDHVGALVRLLGEENNLEVGNIYYSFLEDEWYKEYDKRGYESSHAMLEALSNSKIKNKIECAKGQVINIDNVKVDIIRTPNPEIIHSDNGNDASMTFKITAVDVNKSIIFLGDSYVYASKELLEGDKDILKSNSVQMAHHGQNGVSKEVYETIAPEVCFFNCPKWLWNNDNGSGYNSGKWQTVEVRGWMEELGCDTYVACEGDHLFHFTDEGIIKIEE